MLVDVAGGSPRSCGRPWWRSTRTAWPSPYIVMSTRMRPTHNSQGNNAELRVLLLKWCRKKGGLWRVESQFCKPQFKFCSVTFPQVRFLCASISAEWGKLEQIKNNSFARRRTVSTFVDKSRLLNSSLKFRSVVSVKNHLPHRLAMGLFD